MNKRNFGGSTSWPAAELQHSSASSQQSTTFHVRSANSTDSTCYCYNYIVQDHLSRCSCIPIGQARSAVILSYKYEYLTVDIHTSTLDFSIEKPCQMYGTLILTAPA